MEERAGEIEGRSEEILGCGKEDKNWREKAPNREM